MDYKKLVESLGKMLPPKIPYGELVGAPWPYTGQGKMVYEDPESYFIEQAITAINDLLARAESAEARAEKAERERDIAVEQLHHCENNCDYCRNRCECDKETCFSPSPITGEPTDYWKWCGLEE